MAQAVSGAELMAPEVFNQIARAAEADYNQQLAQMGFKGQRHRDFGAGFVDGYRSGLRAALDFTADLFLVEAKPLPKPEDRALPTAELEDVNGNIPVEVVGMEDTGTASTAPETEEDSEEGDPAEALAD